MGIGEVERGFLVGKRRMEWLFGKQKTPQEILRENQRMLRKSIREIDRERMALENQEKKAVIEIRKMAKTNQMAAAKILAKDLVRTRAHIKKFITMRTQLQAVSTRLQTLKSTAAMADAMKGVTIALMRMNRAMNLPAMQKVMMEFERQSELMDMKEEMMEDTMDDMMGEEDEEGESEEILNQVLDEIGIGISSQLVSAPATGAETTKVPTAGAQQKTAVAELDSADNDLLARLDNLRK